MTVRNRELLLATVWGFALVALNPRPAHAYIDPGVGLLVVQGIVASVVGSLFFARRMIMQFFRSLLGKGAPKPPDRDTHRTSS